MGGIWPITARREHPVVGWLYVIHEQPPDAAHISWNNIGQAESVKAMDAAVVFELRTIVDLPPAGL